MNILIRKNLQLQLVNNGMVKDLQKDTDLIQWADIKGIKFFADCNSSRNNILESISNFLGLEETTSDDVMIAICESCDEFSEFYDELTK